MKLNTGSLAKPSLENSLECNLERWGQGFAGDTKSDVKLARKDSSHRTIG